MSKVSESELALLRSYPHASKVYLGVERGIDLLTARADGSNVEGETSILLKDVILPTGDADDLLFGMTVALHSVANNNRRVDAYFVSYDSGTQILVIGANARQVDDDFYITVFSSMKLWKIPESDWDGDQHILPFGIMGPPRAWFVNETVNFVGANSYSPVGREITNYVWKKYDANLVSGSLTAANTVDDPLGLEWDNVGEYIVRLSAGDDASEFSRTFRPVLMFERSGANAPYSEVIIGSCKFNGSGWSADVTCFGVADSEAFPPQALVILFAEDWYGSVKRSIGGPFRDAGSEVVFCGWIRDGSVIVSADEKSVTFTLDSVEALMQRVTMDDFTFRDGDDATGWHSFNGLTLTKAAAHIIQQHTTLARMADVFLALFPYSLDILDVPSAFLYDQLTQSIGSTAFAYVAGSRFASVTIARNRNMLSPEQRGYLKLAAIQFDPQDWLRVTVQEEKFSSTSQVVLEGQDGTGFPLRAVYPVSGPSGAGAIVTQSGMLFQDQAQADELAELMWRRDNRGVKGITIELPNYRVLEPAFQEYMFVYLPTAYNNRGNNWIQTLNGLSGREFYCTGMDIAFRDGAILVTMTGERSNYGPTGTEWEIADPPPVLEYVPGMDQNPQDGATGTE